MSRHGMFVLNEKKNTPAMVCAGVKKTAAKGEENLQVIWPKEDGLWKSYDVRNKSLDTRGIGSGNELNPRRARLAAEDRAQIEAKMTAGPGSKPWQAPYKNKSDVFTHLVDDPRDRRGGKIDKPGSKATSTR